jgi:hypothetical protein
MSTTDSNRSDSGEDTTLIRWIPVVPLLALLPTLAAFFIGWGRARRDSLRKTAPATVAAALVVESVAAVTPTRRAHRLPRSRARTQIDSASTLEGGNARRQGDAVTLSSRS